MSDVVIRAENLGKRYRIGVHRPYKTLREALVGLVRRDTVSAQKTGVIWALKGVSFEVRQGEVVGIIGRNGAGKSTLLKILSRITEPTEGYADVRGRVGSLLEVGTGFHPELTGRENIYLNGAILGMKKAEIESKFDEIVSFAEVGDFLDTPLKRYSSGMYVRLAFAVAAHLEPEILLVDEVLAVGDAEFQRKCIGKMQDITGRGRTVLFVSHNMAAIRGLCRRTLLMEGGKVEFDGDSQQAIDRYLDRRAGAGAVLRGGELAARTHEWLATGERLFHCKEIALLNQKGQPTTEFDSDEEITLMITYECLKTVSNLNAVVVLTNDENVPILRSENLDDPNYERFRVLEPGQYQTTCILPGNLFGEKQIRVSCHLICPGLHHMDAIQALSFDVRFKGYNDNYSVHSKQAYLRPRLAWQTSPVSKEKFSGDAA